MRFFTMIFITLFIFAGKAIAINTATPVTGSVTYSQALTTYQVQKNQYAGFVIAVTNSAPAAGTFTCAASDICTKTAHGYVTGLVVRLTTTAADLPLNLLTGTDYYVIKIDADTFYLATSLVLAQAGTQVDIGDAGTGVHTVTPTALAGASLKLQVSNDGSAWADVPIEATGDATKSGTITTTANYYLRIKHFAANYVRVYYTLTTGQLAISEVSRVY